MPERLDGDEPGWGAVGVADLFDLAGHPRVPDPVRVVERDAQRGAGERVVVAAWWGQLPFRVVLVEVGDVDLGGVDLGGAVGVAAGDGDVGEAGGDVVPAGGGGG